MQKVKSILLFFILSISYFFSFSQKIKIGQEVPDISFGLFGKQDTLLRLSAFRNKVVILDFWATWCGSCIKKFPFLDSLQHEFGNDLQFFLVNPKSAGDDTSKISMVTERYARMTGKRLAIPIAINDTIAMGYFRLSEVTSLPHYVWINREGKLAAITSATYITRENISRFISNDSISLPLKVGKVLPRK